MRRGGHLIQGTTLVATDESLSEEEDEEEETEAAKARFKVKKAESQIILMSLAGNSVRFYRR